jgi:hypothetical protein
VKSERSFEVGKVLFPAYPVGSKDSNWALEVMRETADTYEEHCHLANVEVVVRSFQKPIFSR